MQNAPDNRDRTPAPQPCTACHGAGTVLMSLCCGRGCATCPGDGMFENVECFRCRGAGHLVPGELHLP
jgi:DnaJ-class molecular chaperone